MALLAVHIPRATPEQQKHIVDLVRQVLSGKAAGEDTTEAERAIDRLSSIAQADSHTLKAHYQPP